MKSHCRVVFTGIVLGVCLLLAGTARAAENPANSHTAPQDSDPGAAPSPVSEAFDLDLTALVRAITAVESGGNPRAVGLAGERGLMQIKPETWREVTKRQFGERIPFARAFEPELNQQVGQAYLEYLASHLSHNRDRINGAFLPVLVASYHCGPNCVASAGFRVRRLSLTAQEYVERVLNLHGLYRAQSQMLAMETHTAGATVALSAPN